MADRIDDGVGKKIVEALMMQGEHEESAVQINEELPSEKVEKVVEENSEFTQAANTSSISQSLVDNAFQQSLSYNLGSDLYSVQINDVDCPSNVSILRQLIAKLPAGVSKQTGALIIRQTMEALGISMNSVMSEAQQYRDNLAEKVKECTTTIADYKNQIGILEIKAQQYQRQAVAMGDTIGLFSQSGETI